MTEKSGMEMIEEILKTLNLLSKKIDVLDQNIKKIANSAKVSELIDKHSINNIPGWTKPKITAASPTESQKSAEPSAGMRFKIEASDASKIKKDLSTLNKAPRGIQAAMVRGKMITLNNNEPVPLPDIVIKIFDGKNKLLKETKTNRAGQWMAQLSPGKYVVEMTGKYKGNPLTPVNKVFEVPPGVKEFEVN